METYSDVRSGLIQGRLESRASMNRLMLAGGAYALLYALGVLIRPSPLYLRLQSDFLYLAAPLACLVLLPKAVLRSTGYERAGWLGFGVLVLSWLVADASFTYYDLGEGSEPPFPGVTDVFYYFGYAGLIVGVALTTFSLARLRDARWVLDALTVGLVAGTLGFVLLIEPVLAEREYSTLGTIVLLGYPVLDLMAFVLLTGVLFAMGSQPRRRALVLMAAALALVATDVAYFYVVSVVGYSNAGNPLDLGYIVSYLLLAAAFVLPNERTPRAPFVTASPLAAVLPTAAVALMLAVLVVQSFTGHPSTVVAVGTAVTVWLVLTRQILSFQRTEDKFLALTGQTGELVSVVDDDSTVLMQTGSIENILGFVAPEIVGSRLANLVLWDDRVLFGLFLQRVMEHPGVPMTIEARLVDAARAVRSFELTGNDQRREPALGGIVIVGRDVTKQHKLQSELQEQASRDSLTGLPNAQTFLARLEEELRKDGERDACYVFYLDLDNFKAINDGLGHAIGDQVLQETARRLREHFRPADFVSRLGGDEFGIALRSRNDLLAKQRGSETLAALARPMEIGGRTLRVLASIGIARSKPDEPADEVVSNADAAMYSAKRRGKHLVELFEPSMREVFSLRLKLIEGLQDVVANRELELHYQPIVSLENGRTIAVEALLRWHHPELGLVSPPDFIPLAEQSGAIREIGLWVLEEACREARRLGQIMGDAAPLMNVNISVKQLLDDGFVEAVESALRAAGIDPEGLVLEVTESSIMEDVKACEQVLVAIRKLGVRLALDDFGTGYSSLSQLKELPFDILKIDRAFIQSVVTADAGDNLTQVILDMGRTLSLEVVAEGIEEQEQNRRLRSMGCTAGQGFLFAHPMTREDLERRLRAEAQQAA